MRHPLGRLALLHPFPSALDASLVAILSVVSGADTLTAATLAIAMFGFQVSIGALNDLVDAPSDAHARPAKPIPAGMVSRRAAWMVVVGGGAIGLGLSLLVSPVAFALGSAGYACGVAYDLRLKRMGLGWVAFSAAFPLLLLYAWTGSGGGLPPGWPALLPLAAAAGPALHLANALTDLDEDVAAGGHGLAVRLGRRRSILVMAVLTVVVHLMAWGLMAWMGAPMLAIGFAVLASSCAAVGILGTARGTRRSTAWGWSLQAVGIVALAVAWVIAAPGP